MSDERLKSMQQVTDDGARRDRKAWVLSAAGLLILAGAAMYGLSARERKRVDRPAATA